ncbi:hypothetical protein BDQ12DRAFT_499986 [Crucibulum laeve]|uniref:Uncharacterized protein n=1 Tax=Crucibulum laeve TaxID=68775 RepID=A0A5C3LIA1_9AGAR|nr:hypothetical protein BDQ12DRAFT_499986 [Crucibulum laeve]
MCHHLRFRVLDHMVIHLRKRASTHRLNMRDVRITTIPANAITQLTTFPTSTIAYGHLPISAKEDLGWPGLGVVVVQGENKKGGMDSDGERRASPAVLISRYSVTGKGRETDTEMDTVAQVEVPDEHIASLELVGAVSFWGCIGSDSDSSPTSISRGGEKRRKHGGLKLNPVIFTTGSPPPSQIYIPSAGRESIH